MTLHLHWYKSLFCFTIKSHNNELTCISFPGVVVKTSDVSLVDSLCTCSTKTIVNESDKYTHFIFSFLNRSP